MQMPNEGQLIAFGRHVVSYSMGGITVGVMFHVLSNGQASDAGDAITQISSGVKSILVGASTLIAVASGVWAAWKKSPFAQLLETSQLPGVTQIVLKDPVLANKLPDNVVAK